MLAFLFVTFEILAASAYIPQIIILVRDPKSGLSLSLLTWTIWVLASLISVIYGIVKLGDPYVIGVFSLNLLGCSVVYGLTLAAYWRFKWNAIDANV